MPKYKRKLLTSVVLLVIIIGYCYYANCCLQLKVWFEENISRGGGLYSLYHKQEYNHTWHWDQTKTVHCPSINFNRYSFWRIKVYLNCDERKANLLHGFTKSSPDIQILDPENQCLQTFIQNNCFDNRPVPNVVHYVWYSSIELRFFTFVSLVSVIRFMKPCLIVFHGPFTPRGDLWNYFITQYPYVVSVNSSLITSVYGNKLLHPEHGSDVMRIEILQKYGGLYLDWDEVLLKSVDSLRNYPFTMGLEKAQHLGNQFIMAAPNATFLRFWHAGYKQYSPKWDYNSIVYPYQLAQKMPDHIHIEEYTLLKPKQKSGNFLWYKNSNWAENYGLHFYLRGYTARKLINAKDIRKLNTTLGAVCRHVLFGKKEVCRN